MSQMHVHWIKKQEDHIHSRFVQLGLVALEHQPLLFHPIYKFKKIIQMKTFAEVSQSQIEFL